MSESDNAGYVLMKIGMKMNLRYRLYVVPKYFSYCATEPL